MRADQLLVQRGLAPSRSAAQRLIAQGAVRWLGPAGWAVPRKAGDELPADCELQLTDDAELRWVSRGGLKLEGALTHTGIDVTGRTCLDVGQSTGGFTDVLLQRGAKRVVGIDVGHGQLHPRLRGDARVVALEGVNARHLDAAGLPETCYGLIVGDLSFISLALVLPVLAPLLDSGGSELLMLVKPQFELQPADIGKGGIVRDEAAYARVEARIRQACAGSGLEVTDWFESAVAGGDGNREFFVRAHRGGGAQETDHG
ncbi:TlyA family RNA methyltransferase [uncultured Piscinibacter sp.]|uniref:TlyA family RNA methyltransferase n=1 Tax=uncultured Piscinibacter sp. TaxID=1131835 RepID=UPI00263996EF|nr:TlyA family RNA methyltransferase [uncultured Piscinibacter sp.]